MASSRTPDGVNRPDLADREQRVSETARTMPLRRYRTAVTGPACRDSLMPRYHGSPPFAGNDVNGRFGIKALVISPRCITGRMFRLVLVRSGRPVRNGLGVDVGRDFGGASFAHQVLVAKITNNTAVRSYFFCAGQARSAILY